MLFANAGMQYLFAPVMGGLSDRFGRRRELLFSIFGFGVNYLFLAFAPSIGWLFVGRVVAGITGASFTTASAYIADISTPEKRAQNFGMLGAAWLRSPWISFAINAGMIGMMMPNPISQHRDKNKAQRRARL